MASQLAERLFTRLIEVQSPVGEVYKQSRMEPYICQLVSGMAYSSRLSSTPKAAYETRKNFAIQFQKTVQSHYSFTKASSVDGSMVTHQSHRYWVQVQPFLHHDNKQIGPRVAQEQESSTHCSAPNNCHQSRICCPTRPLHVNARFRGASAAGRLGS